MVKDIVQEEVQPVKENYVQKLKSALARQNFDAYERSVLNVDNTTLRDDGTVVPEFLLARTLNYRRELVRERDNLLSSLEFDRRNIGKIVNGVVIISQEEIIASETRIEEINDEISSIEERGTIFSD